MIVFFDQQQVNEWEVREVVDHPDLKTVAWPIDGLIWNEEGNGSKWNDPQRAMMLAGFVYVPALFVDTPYWLKLDTDVVATGNDDWIDPEWFDENPAIVSHKWGFTKPPDQMLKMDEWADDKGLQSPPLNLKPKEGSDRLSHKRIISWCGFFDTQFTLDIAKMTEKPGRKFEIPVPSQDGLLWYMATRVGRKVVRTSMKGSRGWEHWSTWKNVKRRSKEVMDEIG
jgi:hypothetical protein